MAAVARAHRGREVLKEVVNVGYNFGVGREAPLFSLTAHDGTLVSLSRFRGDWYPVIVFFRPDAAGIDDYLRGLGDAAAGLWGVRGQVVAIAVAPQEELRQLAERVGTSPIPLLADADGAVARLYGAWDKDQGGCTPLAYIADRAHKIVWAQNGAAALPPSVADLEQAFRGFVK